MKKTKLYNLILIGMITSSIIHSEPIHAAEEVNFVNGIFSRKISIKEIENLTLDQKQKGFLDKLKKLKPADLNKISEVLKEKYELPIVITSRLMNSKIGEVILERASKIIYPYRLPESKLGIKAIRSAIIKCLDEGEGKISLIEFLKSYPNKVITINIPSLYKVIDKVESISDLVKFFSDSPLEGLKKVNQ